MWFIQTHPLLTCECWVLVFGLVVVHLYAISRFLLRIVAMRMERNRRQRIFHSECKAYYCERCRHWICFFFEMLTVFDEICVYVCVCRRMRMCVCNLGERCVGVYAQISLRIRTCGISVLYESPCFSENVPPASASHCTYPFTHTHTHTPQWCIGLVWVFVSAYFTLEMWYGRVQSRNVWTI